jgi:hypothetical protein
VHSKKQTLNYSCLLLNCCAERESVWHHTPFLLFTTMALWDLQIPVSSLYVLPYTVALGRNSWTYLALCIICRQYFYRPTEHCRLRHQSIRSSKCLMLCYFLLYEEFFFRSLQLKFNYIATKLARKGKKIYAYRIWVQKPEGKNHLEDIGFGGRIILKLILNKWNERVRTRLIWFRIGTSGGLFWTRKGIFWLHKILGISWIVEKLWTSRQELCFLELADYCLHTSDLVTSTAVWDNVNLILVFCGLYMWHAVAQLVETLRYKPEGSRVRFPMGSLGFFIDLILLTALWSWGRLPL